MPAAMPVPTTQELLKAWLWHEVYSISPALSCCVPCWLALPRGLKRAMSACLWVPFPKVCAECRARMGENPVLPLHHPSSLHPSSSSPGESAEDAQPGCSDLLESQDPRGKTCLKVLGQS